ncbi:MAG: PRC-barrel domain containing protein [Chloroflexota bacterium]|nr:MAG: PRC-barrel domain containing protein [Chloroflexota bacterium]
MIFKNEARIITPEGKVLGKLNRVVINPKTKEISYLVIQEGGLSGEEKVLPVEWVAGTSDDQIRLREDAGNLDALPNFAEAEYVILDETELVRMPYQPDPAAPPGYYFYPSYLGMAGRQIGGTPLADTGLESTWENQPVTTHTEHNIPEDTVGLKEGAKVISDDDKHVGNLEQVLSNTQTGKVSHFVISKGLLLKTKKLVPVDWVTFISEDQVHLGVSSHMIEGLKEVH